MKSRRNMALAPTGAPRAVRAAVYTRKSTAVGLEQEFNSLDAQREACMGYIERQPGWQVVSGSYDDGGFTGANIERPGFQRLLADIDAGKIDVVVVYKVDRLSRSLLDFAKVMERFNASATSFVSVTQNFSTADAMGRLTLNMLMSFAEFEREMIAERTRDKIAAARKKGKWTGGPVPLGYGVESKKLVINELEAVLVREIFSLYVEERSAVGVAKILSQRHHATKRHRAQNGKVREAHRWTKADVLRVLKNPIYAGYMSCGEQWFEAEHEPIIDRARFMKAKALLDAVPKTAVPSRNPDYILRGVLRCACCGFAFTTASTERRGKIHRYYRCVSRDKQGKQACRSRQLSAAAIERFVLERLREATADGTLADEVAEAVKRRAAVRRAAIQVERQKLPNEIAALSAEARRLVDSLAGMTGTARRLVDQRLQEVGDELGRCEARLAAAEQDLATLDNLEVEAGWVRDCLSDFDTIWNVLTPENRGRLLRTAIERVEVNEPANRVHVVFADLELPEAAHLGCGLSAQEMAS